MISCGQTDSHRIYNIHIIHAYGVYYIGHCICTCTQHQQFKFSQIFLREQLVHYFYEFSYEGFIMIPAKKLGPQNKIFYVWGLEDFSNPSPSNTPIHIFIVRGHCSIAYQDNTLPHDFCCCYC